MSQTATAPTAVLLAAVERALRAPSVHNTQPWRWRIGSGAVELHADLSRHLASTDPDRRDLVLSCGAALHHVRAALAAVGVATAVDRVPDPDDSTHLATVRARPGPPDPRLAELAPAMEQRRSDRRRFAAATVDDHVLDTLRAAASANGAVLHVVTNPDARLRFEFTLADAAARQRYVPGYVAELTIWTHRYAGARDGIPAEARTSTAMQTPGVGLRAFPEGRLPPNAPGIGGEHDGSLLLVLTTPEDAPFDRLIAGEAASAVLLAATQKGLATTLISQALEVPESQIRLASEVLRSPDHPQLAIRLGRPVPGAAELPLTPRRTLESVLLRD
jgi:nitroreductase